MTSDATPAKEGPILRAVPSFLCAGGVQRTMSDTRKQSLYFPEQMLQQIQEEAVRQDRSLSWIVQRAWRLARAQIARLPTSGVAQPGGSPTVEAP